MNELTLKSGRDLETAKQIFRTIDFLKWLVRAARSGKLLGAEVVITGIRAVMAQVLVGLGVNLEDVMMRRNLQEGIRHAEELIRRGAA